MNISKLIEDEVKKCLNVFGYVVYDSHNEQQGDTVLSNIHIYNETLDISRTIYVKHRKGRLKIWTPVWFRLTWGWRKLSPIKVMSTIFYVSTEPEQK